MMRTMKLRRWAMMVAAVALLLCGTTAFSREANRPNDQSQRSNQRSSAQSRRAPQAHHGAQQRGGQEAAPRQVQRSARERSNQQAQQRQVWQQHRLPSGQMPDNWEQRGGYRGRLIPSAFFSSHFGVQHRFRVYDLPFQVISGRPRFQFNGYWFEVADPVPAYWGPDWYQSDDVYIVYAYGGYYLNNARFPNRPGIAISVIF